MTSKMTVLEESEFLERLQAALAKLGIPSQREFHLPGTHHKIDLYLPSLPRAALEFKTVLKSEQLTSALAQAAKNHSTYKDELGPTFKTILLAFGNNLDKSEVSAVVPDGIVCLYLQENPKSKNSADLAASQIQVALDDSRKKLFGLASVATMASLLPIAFAFPSITPLLAIAAILPGVGGILASSCAHADSEVEESKNRPYASNIRIPSPISVTTPPSSEAVKIVAAQAENILETFRELAPEAYGVVAHEMKFLVEEFKLGHFTACAMRGGRSLESMVYELSRRWGIEIQDTTFGKLQELRNTLDRIGDLVGDFQVSVGDQRDKLDKDIGAAFVELSGMATSLAMAVKGGQQTSKETRRNSNEPGPRPIVTLLKKIQKRYGNLEGTGENLKSLFDKDKNSAEGSLVDRVIRTRNRAAHADVNGMHQETDEASVKALLDAINVVMLKLSNVGIAIQKKKSQAKS